MSTDTEQVVVVDKTFTTCNSKVNPIGGAPAAWTTGNVDANTIQQIQLCPWYIGSVSLSKRRLLKDLNLKGLALRIAAAGQKVLGLTTAMDDECVLDCDILHEVRFSKSSSWMGSADYSSII